MTIPVPRPGHGVSACARSVSTTISHVGDWLGTYVMGRGFVCRGVAREGAPPDWCEALTQWLCATWCLPNQKGTRMTFT